MIAKKELTVLWGSEGKGNSFGRRGHHASNRASEPDHSGQGAWGVILL